MNTEVVTTQPVEITQEVFASSLMGAIPEFFYIAGVTCGGAFAGYYLGMKLNELFGVTEGEGGFGEYFLPFFLASITAYMAWTLTNELVN